MATRIRSLFLSDIHLGNPACQAPLLLELLAGYRPEHLFLLGDIVDLEYLQRRPGWAPTHSAVLRAILRMARRGTQVMYVPGNHDDALRALCGQRFGAVDVRRFHIHRLADGRPWLLLHGDEFDAELRGASPGERLAGAAYRAVIRLNTAVNHLARALGLGYLPLAASLKGRLAGARRYMDRFRDTVAAAAARAGVAGVICGHIHRPEVATVDGIGYLNTGDWVENCSAVVEWPDGRLELRRWARVRPAGEAPSPLPQPA